ncbi:SCO family protein [Novosphingobium profundi]|uniref:SCO family protein n=1 Tax=Novosphingobium profundi TaxID=1774954 RepID=UPI001FE79562|nr:SCO family protein [Novosphingobium profundi]
MTHLRSRTARRVLAASALALGLSLGACQPASPAHPPIEGTDITGAAIGGDFTLVDKTGKAVRWSDFRGKWTIIYFGYTFCPDACPIDVQEMMKGFNQFAKAHPEAAAKVQPIFITIDPARDTPEIVGQWTGAFGPDLLGLTGTAKQVDEAAKAFAVYYGKGETTSGGYLMDHSRFAYLMNPKGEPIDMLPVDKGAKAVAADLAALVN